MTLNRTFRALADPTRLRILNLLLGDDLCVCELEAALGLPQSLISRHLAYLRNAGLVRDQRHGMRVQYSAVVDSGAGAVLAEFLRRTLASEKVCREDNRKWRKRVNRAAPARQEESNENQGPAM